MNSIIKKADISRLLLLDLNTVEFLRNNKVKILNLLEGSELLYHATFQDAMYGILRTGGIQLTDLRFNPWERGLMDDAHPSSSGKLYFLSMSRNRANDFSINLLKSNRGSLTFRICFTGRTISKYGKIYPINYYGSTGDRGEMEDRLVSDVNKIPFSDFDHVDVLLPQTGFVTDYHKKMLRTLANRVECRFFDNVKNFISGRGAIDFDYDGEGEIDLERVNPFDTDDAGHALIKYLNHETLTKDEIKELKLYGGSHIINTIQTGSALGHKMRVAMKKFGLDNVDDLEKEIEKL